MIRGSGYVTINGTKLYCHETGERGPALVLVHAGNADSSMWDGQFERLSKNHRVLRYDLRGFGQSLLPPGPFSFAQDLVALIGEWDVGPVVAVGASVGGRIALEAALLRPELIRGLMLAAPMARRHPWSDYMVRSREQEAAALEAGEVPAAIEVVMQTWVAGPHRRIEDMDPILVDRLRATQRIAYSVQLAAEAGTEPPGPEHELDPPAEERRAEISAPTEIWVGGADVPDAVEIGQKLAESMPRANLTVIPGVAHMVTMECGDEFIAATQRFVSSLAERATQAPHLPRSGAL
jgi:3-oxoadipate enol-lactonase